MLAVRHLNDEQPEIGEQVYILDGLGHIIFAVLDRDDDSGDYFWDAEHSDISLTEYPFWFYEKHTICENARRSLNVFQHKPKEGQKIPGFKIVGNTIVKE